MTAGPDREDEPQKQLRAAVESIGGHARAVNQERAARLDRALSEMAAGCRGETRQREATEAAHQLVGSAGTFGFSGASELAGEIEHYLRNGDLDDAAGLAAARDRVRRLQAALAAEPDYQPGDDDEPTS